MVQAVFIVVQGLERLGNAWNHSLQFKQQTLVNTARLATSEEYIRLAGSRSLGEAFRLSMRTQGGKHTPILTASILSDPTHGHELHLRTCQTPKQQLGKISGAHGKTKKRSLGLTHTNFTP